MTVLTWYDAADMEREVAFVDGMGTLVLHYAAVWDPEERAVEFNGKYIGDAKTRADAEEVLYQWSKKLMERMA